MTDRLRHIARFQRDTGGAALLELAVALPVVMFLGLGAIEFGNMIYANHLIANGVRDAARYGAGLPQADAAGNSLVSGNNIAMTNMAMRGTADTSGALRVSWWSNVSTVNVTYQTAAAVDGSGNRLYRDVNSDGVITMVTVTADVPYQELAFLSFLGRSAPTLHVSHQERIYGIR